MTEKSVGCVIRQLACNDRIVSVMAQVFDKYGIEDITYHDVLTNIVEGDNLKKTKPDNKLSQYIWEEVRFMLGYTKGNAYGIAMSDMLLDGKNKQATMQVLDSISGLVQVSLQQAGYTMHGVEAWRGLI